ncbi:hypothetical protein ACMFMF_004938 [Clarireedia jacksonii]
MKRHRQPVQYQVSSIKFQASPSPFSLWSDQAQCIAVHISHSILVLHTCTPYLYSILVHTYTSPTPYVHTYTSPTPYEHTYTSPTPYLYIHTYIHILPLPHLDLQ